MQTIRLYRYRKWLGWYNSPGGWNVGRDFGKLANSPFWDGLFPGSNENPAKFFQLDGKQSPKYVASRSGSFPEQTSHLAYLITQKCKEELGVQMDGRVTKRCKVTIIQTQRDPSVEGNPPVHTIPPHSGRHAHVAILPMAISFITCALCGWTYDWFCYSMILLGIISSGLATFVIGSACLKLEGVEPAPTAPPGDGMLMDGDDIVILLGIEANIATITRGKFFLEYEPWVRQRSSKEKRKRSVLGDGMESTSSNRKSDAEAGPRDGPPDYRPTQCDVPVRDEYAAIGLCSLLLVIQLLGQVLLIPQGTFFGHIMFLSSFVASWAYNLYLSSINKEYIQQKLLLDVLELDEQHMQTYSLGTRTTAAPRGNDADEWESFKPAAIIQHFIPNDTQVWITWKQKVLGVISERDRNQEACYGLLQVSAEDEAMFKKDDKGPCR
ncbi:uncharacterized protein EDB91DRAFT_1250339 [Suillus paluster]|uniref:uncharacterized protein n=1 Tax=Suillus paluster TaxID=48578 RepID=UPI001B86F9EF|nr:uncharacterized protein EDB91DRAFT_1250339 [Suillus paluster]KAG1735713.1 hypothetical protein EDB91DRAFT_1250339 [Suillus paluster]